MGETQIISAPQESTSSGKEARQMRREEARQQLALNLLCWTVLMICLALVVGSILFFNFPDEVEFKDIISLVQTVGTIFSGLLGAAIAFYFSSNDE